MSKYRASPLEVYTSIFFFKSLNMLTLLQSAFSVGQTPVTQVAHETVTRSKYCTPHNQHFSHYTGKHCNLTFVSMKRMFYQVKLMIIYQMAAKPIALFSRKLLILENHTSNHGRRHLGLSRPFAPREVRPYFVHTVKMELIWMDN